MKAATGMNEDEEFELEVDQVEPSALPTKHEHKYHVEMEERNGFSARISKRMARNPCLHLWTALILSIVLSGIAMVVGEFSVSAETGGWQSRGTQIADRQTQLMLTDEFKLDLFHDTDDSVWTNLINNVQEGWETDDDEERRRLSGGAAAADAFAPAVAESWVDYLRPQADRIDLGRTQRRLPFVLNTDLERKLQDTLELNGCQTEWYTNGNMTAEPRLWPIWRTKVPSASALDPTVLRDICEAEANTQAHLEAKGLCFGCDTGCLPAYSVVLYARLTVEDGFALSCSELADAWAPFQASTEEAWITCVEDIKDTYDPNGDGVLPSSCPANFSPELVEEFFEVDGKTRYTSSIFATRREDADALYDEVDSYDRGSGSVEAAYDTQTEEFVEIYLDEVLTSDMVLALSSSLVVTIAVIVHTHSPFLTLMGLLQIILSFPLSYFVYTLMAGLDYFPFLNFIGLFVVFALGAGDVFIATDKWKNARLEHPGATTEQIAAFALPDATLAMFLTTLTTAVAFFATAISPVAPIKMFSIFCGLLVVFDYIMNMLLVFPALCIWDKSIQAKGPDGVNCCVTMHCACCGRGSDGNEDGQPTTTPVAHQETVDSLEDEESSFIRRMLFAYYDILHKFRWVLFVASMIALGVCTYFASTLDLPTSSDVRLLENNVQYELNYELRLELLSTSLEKASGSLAYMIWGVVPADTGDHSDPATWSQLVLDDTFDPSSEDAQVYLRDYCEEFFAQDFTIATEPGYKCPIQHFDSWLQEQSAADEPEEIYTENCSGATGLPVAQGSFDPCIIAWSKSVEAVDVLSRNGKVTILLFPFVSRVRFDDQYDILDDEWNLIEDWVSDKMKEAPAGVEEGYFTSYDFWWYDTNGRMISAAYSAVAVALACAAAVILFESRSLVLTVFATLTIFYVLVSVTSILVALGWTLGFLESICFAILIGVSVDFVIHFSHAYAQVPGTADRTVRTKFALIKMGPSILATGLTTILSSCIMLFTVIIFFQQFGLVLVLSIIQAVIGSFVVFLSMADSFGPANPTYLADKVMAMCARKSEEGSVDEAEEDDDDSNPGKTDRTDRDAM